jgi:Holliday junction resolvase
VARNTAAQGAAFERRVIKDLEPYGYDCIRSAASKGKVDVVAIGPLHPFYLGGTGQGRAMLFIQCKITNPLISPAERTGILDLAHRAGAEPLVAYWAKHETTGLMAVHYRSLTGPGPKEWAPWAPGEGE